MSGEPYDQTPFGRGLSQAEDYRQAPPPWRRVFLNVWERRAGQAMSSRPVQTSSPRAPDVVRDVITLRADVITCHHPNWPDFGVKPLI